MNEGVFTYTTASIMRQACSTHGIKMVRCTDLALDCAPQRLLRRGGEADLEEKRGNGVNETHTFATHKNREAHQEPNTTLWRLVLSAFLRQPSLKYTVNICIFLSLNLLQTWEIKFFVASYLTLKRSAYMAANVLNS